MVEAYFKEVLVKVILSLCALYFFLWSQPVNGAHQSLNNKFVIRSAVSKEFKSGLHSKYLAYFAEKLSADLEVSSMSFARRLHELKAGNIDLMVGLQRTENRVDEFIYIFPAYETLKNRFYSLKENSNYFIKYDDFYKKTVGTHRLSKYFTAFDLDKNIEKHPVSTLRQNIQLLLYKRIDAFIHYEESTFPLLKELGLEAQIVKTNYQPEHENRHYLVISRHSPLMKMRPQLKAIIEKAIENGDLLKIRLAHYQQKALKSN